MDNEPKDSVEDAESNLTSTPDSLSLEEFVQVYKDNIFV